MTGAGPGRRNRSPLLTARRKAWLRRRGFVDFFWRSAHREEFTRRLSGPVSEMKGLVVDIGGGRVSPLDRSWSPAAHRLRLDIVFEGLPEVVGDASALPLRSGSVDGIVMCEVLEHVARPEAAVEEVHRVLKPGGVVCGSVPFLMPVHGDPDDYFRYTGHALERMFSRFEDVRISPHGNRLGAAWKLLCTGFIPLAAFNPAMRLLSRRADPKAPEGYTFVAAK